MNSALRSGLPSSGSFAVSNRMFDSVVPPSSLADASLLIDDCDVGGDASPYSWRDDPVDTANEEKISLLHDNSKCYPIVPASLHLDRRMARLLYTKSGCYMDNLLPMFIFGGADKSDQLPASSASSSDEVDNAAPVDAGSASVEATVKPNDLGMAHCQDMLRLQK